MGPYDPEVYWSRVAEQVATRPESYLAGDDDPFLIYKRALFLTEFLDSLDLRGQVALELGAGPGGNLKHIAQRHGAKRILGADISAAMCRLASVNLAPYADLVEIHKIDGKELPFPDGSVDVSFTATVLEHVTDETMFESLVKELCRVTKREIVIMEDIGTSGQPGGRGSWIGRTVDAYGTAFARHAFHLSAVRFLGTKVSRSWYVPLARLRRRLDRRQEGEPIGPLMKLAIGAPLGVTRYLDRLVPDDTGLAKMVFHPRD